MEPLAVDIREAGRLLSLSPRTIRRHIRSGRIKAVRFGRRVLVPMEELIRTLTDAGDGGQRRIDSISTPRTD
jgi:excisionase family DNA binding protein